MDTCQITARIQQSVDRLTPRDSRSEQRLEVRGACAVFNKKVYLKGPLPVPIAELDLKPSPEVKDRVKTILNEWAAGANLISLMSEDLLLHLNLLVGVYPRNCWLFQALVLGKNLPFILLTLYDGDSVDSTPDRHEIADFAMRCARALTSQLLNYCTKDFILLPCTLEYSSFDVQGLREEVKGQKCGAADFYQGPTLLREESCKQICTALSILATASDVPYFFEESPDAGKKLLVGDSEDDNVLRQIISYLRANGAANSQPLTITYTEMTTVVKVILLEAVKRLSYFQRVIVITGSDEVQKCVEKLVKNTKKEFGLDPSWFQSGSQQEAKLSKHITAKDKTAFSNGTAAGKKSADDPTPKNRKIHGSTSSDTGSREGNSDATMNLEKSTTGGKAVGMDDYSVDTYVICIDTPECPKDCHLRLMPSESYRLPRYRVLLVGKSGSGKSSTANTLLGRGAAPFRAAVSFGPVTRCRKTDECQYGDFILEVVETPGVFALSGSFTDWSSDIHVPQNFDAICFVIRIGRFTEEEARVLDRIQQVYRTDVASHKIVIFTGRDRLGTEDFESILDQAPNRLKNLLEKCDGRYCVFDNTSPRNHDQVDQFLKFVRAQKNSDGFRCPTPAELETGWERAQLEDLERKRAKSQG